MAKITSKKEVEPVFADIKKWYEEHLSPNVIDFDDPLPYEVYEKGTFPGIFQCTSPGAQKFFMKAKPKSIIDIAALTSIFRPGPLAAHVDKLWLEHEKVPYDWGHPLINETLKKTRGLLVFQEGVMSLANKVAGFPMAECDAVRRAIMKRSISGGEAAKQKAKELEDSFVSGAIKNGVPEPIARKAYQNILWFSGYGFNASHAIAYSIDSFWCAWFLTYYPEQWLSAYLESQSRTPEGKATAYSEIKSLGYKVTKIDLNYAGSSWNAIPGKMFMPSLLSCKGVGASAIEELERLRYEAGGTFKCVEDLLWNEDGTWKLSKFNKRSLDAMIKIGAFESFDCIGEDKLFSNSHHMHEVIIENMNTIKKSTSKDPQFGKKMFYELARGLRDVIEPWTRKELVEFEAEICGAADVSELYDPAVMELLDKRGVKSIDDYEGKGIYWFTIQSFEVKTSKKNSRYAEITAMGPIGKTVKIKLWGYKDGGKQIPQFKLCFAEIDKNDFGFSTSVWKLKEVNA